MRSEKIKNIGTVDIEKVEVDPTFIFDVHLPLTEIEAETDAIMEKCMEQYKSKHPNIDIKDVNFNFRLQYEMGFDDSERDGFSADLYIWKEEGEECLEIYENISLEHLLGDEEKKTIKHIIYQKLGETVFK